VGAHGDRIGSLTIMRRVRPTLHECDAHATQLSGKASHGQASRSGCMPGRSWGAVAAGTRVRNAPPDGSPTGATLREMGPGRTGGRTGYLPATPARWHPAIAASANNLSGLRERWKGSTELRLPREGEIEHEVESGAIARRGLHLHDGPHGFHQLAADGEAEARARERVFTRFLTTPEGLE
jgi:hypothetical protein